MLGLRAAAIAPCSSRIRRASCIAARSEGPDLMPLAPRNEIDLATAWQLSKIVRQWQPEIVHAHDPHAVAMAALALSFGAPTPRPKIVASRRVDFHLQSHAFSQWKYRQVDAFIAASRAINDILVQDGIPAAASSVVHDGIDVEKIAEPPATDLHAEYWLPHGVPVIVNVGALVGHKGQSYLIDAMPLVLREVPDAHLVISGEGELRAPLERQIKQLSLIKRVLLPGFREDVMSLMKSADLFVMTSVTEGLGSAVLDAWRWATPWSARRAGGIPEAVMHDETGLARRARRREALAAAIVRMLKDRASKAIRRSRPGPGRGALRRRSARRGNARGLSLLITSNAFRSCFSRALIGRRRWSTSQSANSAWPFSRARSIACAVVVRQRRIGAVRDQQLGERAIGLRSGFVDGAEAGLLLRVRIGAGLEHGLHDLELPAGDRGMQRGDLQRVLRGRVHVGAGGDQRLDGRGLAEERRERDRREAVRRMLGHSRGDGLQDFLDPIDLAEHARFEDVDRRAELEQRVHHVGLHVVGRDQDRRCAAGVARLLQRGILPERAAVPHRPCPP